MSPMGVGANGEADESRGWTGILALAGEPGGHGPGVEAGEALGEGGKSGWHGAGRP